MSLRFIMRESESSIDEYKEQITSEYGGFIYEGMEPVSINGWNGYRSQSDIGPSGINDYSYTHLDDLLLPGHDQQYIIINLNLTETPDEEPSIEANAQMWEAALATLKRI